MFVLNFSKIASRILNGKLRDVDEGDEILRDYLEGPEATDDSNRAALSNVWRRTDLTHVDWRQAEEPKEEFFAVRH